ncbi:hypothetical protein JHK85_010442 [Glycine max]|nr:hypothetical protein JHK85_010442 [Glycine max]
MVDHYNKYGILFQSNSRFLKTLRFLHQIINNNNNNKHRKLGYLFIDFWCRLVKLAARAFYDDLTSKGENQPKSGRSDNRGIAVVILDALTRRQWVREEDLAKDLKLHTKQLRRTLRFFEEEKIITREYRRETAKGAKMYSAATAATVDVQLTGKEGEEKIYDVVRYRIHRMKKLLKDELDNKNTIEEYICRKCGKRYNALDALRLVSFEDDDFHCESCNGKLEVESDKFVAQEGGDGDENARRWRHEKLKDMLQKMEKLSPSLDSSPHLWSSPPFFAAIGAAMHHHLIRPSLLIFLTSCQIYSSPV